MSRSTQTATAYVPKKAVASPGIVADEVERALRELYDAGIIDSGDVVVDRAEAVDKPNGWTVRVEATLSPEKKVVLGTDFVARWLTQMLLERFTEMEVRVDE